ncbi:MAG TPA: zinc-dependent alcohol dehydrogenase family protein [Firmicutes bacterium]|nr:zinc-dependent alcohol dehydrogenase family protein [Bacillota bacterium]
MRAMYLEKAGPADSKPLMLTSLSVPAPKPGEARLRVLACGVCHTDLHIVEGELSPPKMPIVPGHQIVGIVDEVNPLPEKPAKVKVGERVGVPWLYRSCGKCEYCLSGKENLCNAPMFTGFSVDGGYEEYMLAHIDFLVKIPDTLSDTEAAPLLCAGIIGHRSLKVAGVRPGDTVGLFGFGASAHLALQEARGLGCSVQVFTRSPKHQKLAMELGATWAGRPGDVPPKLCDECITFAPVGSVIPHALGVLKRGGAVAINAVHLDGIPEFPYSLVYWERKISSVANATRQDAEEFMEIAGRIPIRPVVEVYPLEEANEALIALKHGTIQGAAVLQIADRL